jgi:hypothetical protein
MSFLTLCVFNQSGEAISVVQPLVNQILHKPYALVEFLGIAQDHHKNFNVYMPSVRVGSANDSIYLLKTDQQPPLLRLVESPTISGDAVVRTSQLPLKHVKARGHYCSVGNVPYEGKQAMIVASKDKLGNTKASFDTGERSVQLQRPPETDATSG